MNKQFEHRARIEKYLAENRAVGGGTTTTILTDLTTVLANITAAQQNRGAGGSPVSGVILDPTAMVNSIQLRMQETKAILNYLIYGNMIGSGSAGQAGAPFLGTDSNHANTLDKLTGILADLA